MGDVVSAFGGSERREGAADGVPEGGLRPGRRAPPRLEFGKDLFDRIVLGGIRGEEEQGGPRSLNRLAHRHPFVDGEIVQADRVARPQRRASHLLDVGPEGEAVQGPGQQHRRREALGAQASNAGGRPPVPMW